MFLAPALFLLVALNESVARVSACSYATTDGYLLAVIIGRHPLLAPAWFNRRPPLSNYESARGCSQFQLR